MNSKLRVRIAIGVVASALLLGGSVDARKAAKPKPEPTLSARIVGQWASEPFESSVGKATQTFCWSGERLVLTDESAQARTYDRGANGC
jgi:hypothetical protein